MSGIIAKFFICITLFLALMGCTSSTASTPEAAIAVPENRALVIGDISDEAAETIKGTQPVADYLAAQLSDFGITEGVVRIAPDLETMITWMDNGEVDTYFDSPYPSLVISEATGATPILRRLKYGVDEYHTVFFQPRRGRLSIGGRSGGTDGRV
ncbi:MAG: PhnD/SsuA/transferrin family substrate-binding protein [Chloroflexi bacterium]|nr:PhnD/SsuA/transferrin family substrate-binding protein [Chloroflexota bacterium]